jgi:hypothetical protein
MAAAIPEELVCLLRIATTKTLISNTSHGRGIAVA